MTYIAKLLQAAVFGLAIAFSATVGLADEKGEMVDGVVKEVRANGDLTIKHGPIKNLDMSAMTMVFKMKDKSVAKGVKVGDSIKFHVEDVGGKLTITKLEKAK